MKPWVIYFPYNHNYNRQSQKWRLSVFSVIYQSIHTYGGPYIRGSISTGVSVFDYSKMIFRQTGVDHRPSVLAICCIKRFLLFNSTLQPIALRPGVAYKRFDLSNGLPILVDNRKALNERAWRFVIYCDYGLFRIFDISEW